LNNDVFIFHWADVRGGINIWTLQGADTVNIGNVSGVTSVSLDTGDGDDVINLSQAARDLSTISGPVTITGGTGTKTFRAFDETHDSDRSYTLAGGALSINGLPGMQVHYANISNVALLTATSALSNTITVQAGAAGSTLYIAGEAITNHL